jgi:hypothetical protein
MVTKVDTLDVEAFINPDTTASFIANKWTEWDSFRNDWKQEKLELRNYVYATDTRSTSNNRLPWTNSTTVPKLTQIYDNLKANYLAALFPQKEWLAWEAGDLNALDKNKAQSIKQFILHKLRTSNFELTVERLIDDFILYGNSFATVEWVEEYSTINEGTPLTESVKGYIGPKLVRISPYDIVFNPAAENFYESPKIIRSIVTLGSLEKMGVREEYLDRVLTNRKMIGTYPNLEKQEAFVADGFSDLSHYYGSDYVEILTFYGDIYDKYTGELQTNRVITVVDRAYEVKNEPIASWLGRTPIFHAGWRSRPDNLYAMGPLDNLVGMQYRGDHLENLKADVFDQIALPQVLIQGDVEDFIHEPGGRIYMGEEGSVSYLQPDGTALAADNQIIILHQMMEEFAGAPREAMGIRTPGEKTAFEMDILAQGTSRIFQHKTSKYEKELLEPVLEAMLESSRRNMEMSEVVAFFDDEDQVEMFKDITKDDLSINGKLKPVGSRHFAEKARKTQNLNNLIQIKIADPSIGVHLSGKEIAKMLTEQIDEENVFQPNVGIQEQLETQEAAQDAEAQNMENLQIKQELGQ